MNARPSFFGLAVLLALTSVGCSAVLHWDENNLPCDSSVVGGRTHFCLDGYHCQDDSLQCVRDGSLTMGHACTQAASCAAGLTCPIDLLGGGGVAGSGGVHQCLAGCNTTATDKGFLQADGCSDRLQVCLPYLNVANSNVNKALLGACLPSANCTSGASCALNGNDDGTCVAVSDVAQACLQGCEVTWTTTPTYTDNCDALHSCVPVGAAGEKRFVCMYNATNTAQNPNASVAGQTPGVEGAACSTVLAPCAKGLVCSQGVCARYCQLTSNTTSNCPTGESCCQFSGLKQSSTSGYCASSCK